MTSDLESIRRRCSGPPASLSQGTASAVIFSSAIEMSKDHAVDEQSAWFRPLFRLPVAGGRVAGLSEKLACALVSSACEDGIGQTLVMVNVLTRSATQHTTSHQIDGYIGVDRMQAIRLDNASDALEQQDPEDRECCRPGAEKNASTRMTGMSDKPDEVDWLQGMPQLEWINR
jgi:hypothetical protein